MIEVVEKLFDSTFASALLAAVFTVVGLFVTERFAKKRATEERDRTQLDTAKVYAAPLSRSLISLIDRLDNIFINGTAFLDSKAPDNEYYRYMFRSTIYRLCVVLGWLRAAEREHSGIEVNNLKADRQINEAIKNFRGSLAKGRQLAKTRLMYLSKKWGISLTNLGKDEFNELGSKIEETIWQALLDQEANFAYELPDDTQIALLEKIFEHIKEYAQIEELDISIVKEKQYFTIRALSRVESWIYHDWQAAIGDMMLVNTRADDRLYEVIGFSRFEDLYIEHKNDETENNRWVERTMRLFRDLDLRGEDVFDARAQQLQDVRSSALNLVCAIANAEFRNDEDDRAYWEKRIELDKDVNGSFYP